LKIFNDFLRRYSNVHFHSISCVWFVNSFLRPLFNSNSDVRYKCEEALQRIRQLQRELLVLERAVRHLSESCDNFFEDPVE